MQVSLVDEVFIAHAEAGSKTGAVAVKALSWGKRVYTLDHPANRHLVVRNVVTYGNEQ